MSTTPRPRHAYLGPEGTFAETALRSVAGHEEADLVPMDTVADALAAVRDGSVRGAMVPFENSVEGAVGNTLDELVGGSPLHIAREVLVPVRLALLVRPGTGLGGVRAVASHPHATAQSRHWLRANLPEAAILPAASTAEAAANLAAGTGGIDAAISGPGAAERYGLVELAASVGDHPEAVTRFIFAVAPGPLPEPTGADRTTVVTFIAEDHPGALLEILTEFAVRSVNLTRLESRPTGHGLGRYCFSMDCEGHVSEARVGDALAALHRVCDDVRFCGSYPRADGEAPTVRRGTGDADFGASSDWLREVRLGRL
ncbi:MAG: prephenate dehydratase [Candidatus Dormibacteria bacterium]|jgi:prephenate dehydratase